METVTLKSRVGPINLAYRPIIMTRVGPMPEKHLFHFTQDNDFRVAVPRDWWEQIKGSWLDKTANLKYKEALIEL